MVIWLIGISGAGKSTLGKKLKEYFYKLNKKCYLIDGEWVRNFYNNDLGYSAEERVANIKRIILAAYVLNENNIITIVCNISPFEELRRFAREKIIQYNEIFLKRSLEFSKKVKNMYRENLGKTPIVGIDIGFDEPKNSDLVIDMDKEGIDGAFKRIINYIRKKYPEEFGETYIRDKQ